LSQRLIVVSNRVSVPKSKRPAPGGLAVGILAALRNSGGLWYGWNGKVAESDAHELEHTKLDGIEFVTTSLTKQEYDGYYKGYANRVLWPLCHLRLNLVEYQRRFFDIYLNTNTAFAERIAPLIGSDDIVWIHDYHCIPMGRKLRKLGVDNAIGFFLHIPFPPYDVFRAVPDHKMLLKYFFSYNLVGFQTELDRDSFLDTVSRILPDAEVGEDYVVYKGNTIKVRAFPIGVDYDNILNDVEVAHKSTHIRRLRENLRDRKLITGVDRLDYSKGLAQRFEAFDHLLNRYTDHREDVVFMQVAQPSRNDVPEYQAIKDELDFLAGKINGRFAQYDRIPLRYLNRSFSRATILGFLSISHVGLITPLRDGMNLVAKEFVAAQNPQDPGVLILSRLTGAAQQLKSALMVTPYNIDGVADMIDYALSMPLAERRERWQDMIESVRGYTVVDWAEDFVSHLAAG
jgi:trehalose 6-phosphate synthase